MKIAHVVTSISRGGAEVLSAQLLAQFAQSGHEATLISLADILSLGGTLARSRAMKAEIERSGVRVVELNLQSRTPRLRDWAQLRRTLNDLRPDVLHCHTARGLLLSAFSGVPRVYTHHTSAIPFPYPLMRVLDSLADCYVGIGSACAAELRTRTWRPVVVIPNAASIPADQPKHRTHHRPLRFCCLGNIRPQKNYQFLIEVVGKLRARLSPDLLPQFEIAGGGPDLEAIRAVVTARGLSDQIKFIGPTDGSSEVLSRNDVLLNCSPREGLPISMIEAAMAGLPVVATRSGDVPMVVRDRLNGRLVPPGDGDALCDVLCEVATIAKADYDRWSDTSKSIGAEFSLHRCATQHLALYASVAGTLKEGSTQH